jgi:hypothetical protein
MPKHEELYFCPQINKPHQRWSALEDLDKPGYLLALVIPHSGG